jgi:hypothetical protein
MKTRVCAKITRIGIPSRHANSYVAKRMEVPKRWFAQCSGESNYLLLISRLGQN